MDSKKAEQASGQVIKDNFSCPMCGCELHELPVDSTGYINCPECDYGYNPTSELERFRDDPDYVESEVPIDSEHGFIQEVLDDIHRAIAACAKIGYKILTRCESEIGKREMARLYELSSKPIYSEDETRLAAVEESIHILTIYGGSPKGKEWGLEMLNKQREKILKKYEK